MIFSIILIALVGLVAYFHYAQGLFTAAISLCCALIATLVAFGYYENLVNILGQGKMSDFSAGAMLVVLFAVTYLVLRIIFDAVVPGNVGFPLYVERVGAAIVGLAAGLLSVGVFAVAAQLMPFGPSIAMASRFEVANRDRIIIPAAVIGGNLRSKDTAVANELVPNALEPSAASGLLLPVDNIVLSLVSLASGGGMSGSQSFAAIHPDLPGEAFGARLGADWSATRSLISSASKPTIEIGGVFTVSDGITGADVEVPEIRPGSKPLTLAKSGEIIVVRAQFQDVAADKDGYVRVTPSAVRLVIDGINYHPIGTMAKADLVGLNRLDDQIPVVMRGTARAADFAFSLPKSVAAKITTGGKSKGGIGVDVGFIEIKLFGRVDLQGKVVTPYTGPNDAVKILRKNYSPLGQILSPPKPKAAE